MIKKGRTYKIDFCGTLLFEGVYLGNNEIKVKPEYIKDITSKGYTLFGNVDIWKGMSMATNYKYTFEEVITFDSIDKLLDDLLMQKPNIMPLNKEDLSEDLMVCYIPKGKLAIPDNAEYGRVSSWNDTYVHVKFYNKEENGEWDFTKTKPNSQACRLEDLYKVNIQK